MGDDDGRVASLAFMAAEPRREAEYQFISQWFSEGGTFLDVGCGAGGLMRFAQDRGMRAVGLDGDAENVALARANGLDVRRADVFDSADHGRFDLISMVHLVEHFSPSDALRLVRLYSSRLNSDGKLLIVTPNFADWTIASKVFWLDPTHVRPYPPELLSQMLRSCGLRVSHSSAQQFMRLGPRGRLSRIVGRIRFGNQYQRNNSVVVGQLRV